MMMTLWYAGCAGCAMHQTDYDDDDDVSFTINIFHFSPLFTSPTPPNPTNGGLKSNKKYPGMCVLRPDTTPSTKRHSGSGRVRIALLSSPLENGYIRRRRRIRRTQFLLAAAGCSCSSWRYVLLPIQVCPLSAKLISNGCGVTVVVGRFG